MTVQSIGPTATLLFLPREELQQRDLHPHQLTQQQAEELARECLFSLGRSVDCILELEGYPGEDGLLLFIRTAPTVWRFSDSDALLNAMALLPSLTSQPMYWWKETFWLVGEDNAPLSEFADCMEDDPLLHARLAEYALPLF